MATNTGNAPIEVCLQRGIDEWKTGHFNPGETRELAVDIGHVAGTECKIKRWRPGFLGGWGEG